MKKINNNEPWSPLGSLICIVDVHIHIHTYIIPRRINMIKFLIWSSDKSYFQLKLFTFIAGVDALGRWNLRLSKINQTHIVSINFHLTLLMCLFTFCIKFSLKIVFLLVKAEVQLLYPIDQLMKVITEIDYSGWFKFITDSETLNHFI